MFSFSPPPPPPAATASACPPVPSLSLCQALFKIPVTAPGRFTTSPGMRYAAMRMRVSPLHVALTPRTIMTLYVLGCDLEDADDQSGDTAFGHFVQKSHPNFSQKIITLMRLGAKWMRATCNGTIPNTYQPIPRERKYFSPEELMIRTIKEGDSVVMLELLEAGWVNHVEDAWLLMAAGESDGGGIVFRSAYKPCPSQALPLLLSYGGNAHVVSPTTRRSLLQILTLQQRIGGVTTLLSAPFYCNPNETRFPAASVEPAAGALPACETREHDKVKEISPFKRDPNGNNDDGPGGGTQTGGGTADEAQREPLIFSWCRRVSKMYDSIEATAAASMFRLGGPAPLPSEGGGTVSRSLPMQDQPLYKILQTFLEAPSFNLSCRSQHGRSLLAAITRTGVTALLELYLTLAASHGIPVDINERFRGIPICFLRTRGEDSSSSPSPSSSSTSSCMSTLLQRGASVDGWIEFKEMQPPESSSSIKMTRRVGLNVMTDISSAVPTAATAAAPVAPLGSHFGSSSPSATEEKKSAKLRINVPRMVRETFVTWALLQSTSEAILTLLQYSQADADVPNERGLYPLFIVAQQQQRDVAEGLFVSPNPSGSILRPASRTSFPSAPSDASATEVNPAARGGVNLSLSCRRFQMVFDRCRRVDIEDDHGNNVLHYLAIQGAGDMLQVCLGDIHPDAWLPHSHSHSPSSHLPRQRDDNNNEDDRRGPQDDSNDDDVDHQHYREKYQCMNRLLNQRNHAGYTPVMIAMVYGYWDVVPLLVRHGGDPSALTALLCRDPSSGMTATVPLPAEGHRVFPDTGVEVSRLGGDKWKMIVNYDSDDDIVL